MFSSRAFSKSIKSYVKRSFVAKCDDSVDADNEYSDGEGMSIIEQADAAIESSRERIKTPMQFENLKNTLSQGTVNSYDGFRAIVQKQVNLNTVVTHFYWLGSQATGQPIYQYRLIFPVEDKALVNVSTDMDFNIEGEAKYTITDNISTKSNLVLSEQQNSVSVDLEVTDSSSATQFQYAHSAEPSLSLSYMQSITPFLTLGGMGQYLIKERNMSTALGGLFELEDHTVAAQWDKSALRMLYLRKVNPNRVHITTDLLVDEGGNSQMTLGAEFFLKQSKLHMSLDSNMLVRSSLETSLTPGMQMQFAAEVLQSKNHYRFGFGIVMG